MDLNACSDDAVRQIIQLFKFHAFARLQHAGQAQLSRNPSMKPKNGIFFLCASVSLCQKLQPQNTAIGLTGDPLPPSTGIGANVSMKS